MSEEEAHAQAVDYTRKREALYQAAVKKGYGATDEEVWEYLEQFKQEVQEYKNGSIVDAMMDQFDSEEDYWEFEFTVYKKNLPIQNYVHDLEQEYLADPDNSGQSWEDYFEEYKAKLAAGEHYEQQPVTG